MIQKDPFPLSAKENGQPRQPGNRYGYAGKLVSQPPHIMDNSMKCRPGKKGRKERSPDGRQLRIMRVLRVWREQNRQRNRSAARGNKIGRGIGLRQGRPIMQKGPAPEPWKYEKGSAQTPVKSETVQKSFSYPQSWPARVARSCRHRPGRDEKPHLPAVFYI